MLLNLIDHLPGHTHFFNAMAQDEEYAAMVLEAQAANDGPPSGPSLVGWTPEMGMLTVIADRLDLVRQAVIGSLGGKPGEFVPLQRPKTALDRVKNRVRWAQHDALVARMLPRE